MLLPAMGASLDLDYKDMGFISTANFVGYFLAVAATAALVKRIGKRRLIAAGCRWLPSGGPAVSRQCSRLTR